MKKVFYSLVLLCGLALVGTSCKDNNGGNSNVTPEVASGEMTVNTTTSNIISAKAVTYGQKNAIVLASKEMTASDNEGIAIIFNSGITPGTYTMGGNSKDPVPTVVGFHDFNLGELPFIMGADTLFYGDTYYWMNGELAVVQNSDGTYHIVLSQCMGASDNGQNVNLALNFTGPLGPYTFDTNNKFKIKNIESPIGLAGLSQLSGLSSLGLDVKSMLFMSANRKRFYIVSYLGGQLVDGEYNLGYIGTPWVPIFPCVHVTLDGDFWTFQPQTGYIAKEGTLKVVTNDDGTKTVTMENLKLKNVEHDSEFFFPILDGSLQYHGYMYELSL
jgi:hypothetical protein